MSDMRKELVTELMLSADDPRMAFLTVDVGFSFLEPLKEKMGDRFVNFGIAEQAAVTAACGMAKEGMQVWLYSMIPFVLFRPFEAVRNHVGMSQANVKLVGVSGSAGFSMLGFSHNMVSPNEDLMAVDYGLEYLILDQENYKRQIAQARASDKPFYIRV